MRKKNAHELMILMILTQVFKRSDANRRVGSSTAVHKYFVENASSKLCNKNHETLHRPVIAEHTVV